MVSQHVSNLFDAHRGANYNALAPVSTGVYCRQNYRAVAGIPKGNEQKFAVMADEAADSYDREIETLDRRSLSALQGDRLGSLLEELAENRFYQEKFQLAGIDMRSLRSAEDLKRLPFTTKSELIAEQQTHPPYGRLLTYPLERYRYLHQTSGTTFQPIKWLDTSEDWESWMRCWGHVYRAREYARKTWSSALFRSALISVTGRRWTAPVGQALCLSGGGRFRAATAPDG
jgi:hypothetical protein